MVVTHGGGPRAQPHSATRGRHLELSEKVTEGMDVFDADGDKVGTVETVRMGDPSAATAEGQGSYDSPFSSVISSIFGDGHNLSEEQAERLLRVGYIRIDRPLLHADRYIASDRIASVDDAVHLSVDVD